MKSSLQFLALSLTILFIVALKTVVGDTLANTIMWGIAGWQIGEWAHKLGSWWHHKYFKGRE